MDPIRHSVTVAATPEVAFEVFTLGMGGWWDPAYTPDPDSFDGIALGPEVASPVAMVHGTTSYPFGNVTVWEPGDQGSLRPAVHPPTTCTAGRWTYGHR